MGRSRISYALISTRMDGSETTEYQNIREAEKITGVNRKSIRDTAMGAQKNGGGYFWKFKNASDIPASVPGRAILQLTDEGKVVCRYISIFDASRSLGFNSKCIRDAANGKQKHAGGYVWRYER